MLNPQHMVPRSFRVSYMIITGILIKMYFSCSSYMVPSIKKQAVSCSYIFSSRPIYCSHGLRIRVVEVNCL